MRKFCVCRVALLLLAVTGLVSAGEPTDVVRRTTLVVHDVEASVRFYRDVLGFTVWLDNVGKVNENSLPVDLPVGAPSRFVIMKGRHPWVGMVGLLQYGDARPLPTPRAYVLPGDAVLMIETTDIDNIYERMQSSAVRILREPHTSDVTGAGGARWRATFLFAYDPDGHLLEINQRWPLVAAPDGEAGPTPTQGVVATVRRAFFDGRFGQLHYRRADPVAAAGVRAPMVLLHQTPLSSRMFETIMPPLAADRIVYALDTPGYGESASPPSIPSLRDYGDALHEFIAELKEPVDLVGYHTGALIAADIAARHPEAVRRLVLISMPLLSAEKLQALQVETPLTEDGSHLLSGWQSTMKVRPAGQSIEQAAALIAEKQRAGSRAGWAMAAIRSNETPATLAMLTTQTTVIQVNDGLKLESAAAAEAIPGVNLIVAPNEWAYGIFDAYPREIAALLKRVLDEPAQ